MILRPKGRREDGQEMHVLTERLSRESRKSLEESVSPNAPSAPSQASEERTTVIQYLGSTSFSAVFTESQHHPELQELPEPEPDEKDLTISDGKDSLVPRSVIQEGVEVLLQLANMTGHQEAMDRWEGSAFSFGLLPYIEDTIKIAKRSSSSKSGIFSLSERLFLNTSRPLQLQSSTTMQDLPAMILGDSLRWDIVGLMLTEAGLGNIGMDEIRYAPDNESKRADGLDWKSTAKKYVEAGEKCIYFFERLGNLNEIGGYLVMMNYILHTQVYGDAGKSQSIGLLVLGSEQALIRLRPYMYAQIGRYTVPSTT